MRKNRIFYFFGIFPFFFIVGILTLFIIQSISADLFFSLFYGFIFPSFNFFIGTISIRFGFKKSENIFLIVVFGGIVVRLFLMLILIVIAVKILFVTLYSFIFTTFIFYFYYLIVEIFILVQKKNLII